MSNPVIIIHGTKWCGACKHLLSGNRYEKMVNLIKELNPEAEIKIIYHEGFRELNQKEEYPRIDYLPSFPMVMITTKDNCTSRGNMNKVKINGYKYKDGKLVRQSERSLASLDQFLRSNL